MFGYVLPILSSLPEEERKRYKAAYCGLCRSLKAQYGFRARFLVNYDMTFLYCLLSKEKEAQMDHCSCPAKPFCKKDCMPNDETMLYAADLTVLLSWWKLKDGVQDSGFFKRAIYRMGLGLYRKAYVRAATRRKRENEAFEQQLAYLNELEKSRCPSMDRVADTFASLLRVCTGEQTSVSEQRILQTLLYHVGRYLYLVDALEDLPKDQSKGCYNPLCYRYRPVEGKLTAEDRDSLVDTIEASVSLAASALELLPRSSNRMILENIIYNGLPTVLKSVCDGTFRKRKLKQEESKYEGPL